MPATPFHIDISKPGSGVSITVSNPAQTVFKQDRTKNQSWSFYYNRDEWRCVETIEVKVAEDMVETYYIIEPIPAKTPT